MRTIKGIPVSSGIAIGEVFVLEDERRRIPKRVLTPDKLAREHERLDEALATSIAELSGVRTRTQQELGDEAAKIFAFHLGMLADKTLTRPMHELIDREQVGAEYAVSQAMNALAERFTAMGDAAFKTKVDDVNDLSARVLRHLIGESASRLGKLNHRAIVLARDLTPSQAANFNRAHVLGFVTELGGKTGHTGIFARALGIPAIVGAGKVSEQASDGTPIIVDGESGTIILDPDERTLALYQEVQQKQSLMRVSLGELAKLPCVTQDGVTIELLGNIEFPDEIPNVLAAGGQGVGLYRTEYLYLASNKEPTEEDHFNAYAECVKALGGKTLTIRTVDLGADKYTQERAENPERNPMLGCRSIRYCLVHPAMFKRQLRAILRASALGPIRVMFPLVTTSEEFRRARFVFNDVMEDLRDEGIAYDRNIKVGMMVEVPAAALCAEVLAQQAEFFSIGTNDLVQYTLAVDRTNELVAGMYNPASPAVTALVRMTVAGAAKTGIPVSCCGESAGELENALLLLGLGLRTLSASARYLPALKRLVRSVTIQQCESVAQKASEIDSDVAVTQFLRETTRKIIPEAFDGRSVGG